MCDSLDSHFDGLDYKAEFFCEGEDTHIDVNLLIKNGVHAGQYELRLTLTDMHGD
jgi:hypothetical protein